VNIHFLQICGSDLPIRTGQLCGEPGGSVMLAGDCQIISQAGKGVPNLQFGSVLKFYFSSPGKKIGFIKKMAFNFFCLHTIFSCAV